MTDDNEMTHREFIAAQFFTPESEMPSAPHRKPRKSRKRDPGILALGRFARSLDAQNDNARRAAILWLADRFLGIRGRW